MSTSRRQRVEEDHDVPDNPPAGYPLVAVVLVSVVTLAVGGACGFVFGNVRGTTFNAKVATDAREAAERAQADRDAADAKMRGAVADRDAARVEFEQAVQQRDAKLAEADKAARSATERATKAEGRFADFQLAMKADEEQRKKMLAEGSIDENHLLADFADNPEKYKGRTITVRLKYDEIGTNLRDYVTTQMDRGQKIVFVKFYGYAPKSTTVNLTLGVEKGTDLPAAEYGNEVMVTLLCAVADRNGSRIATGLCNKVIRPKK